MKKLFLLAGALAVLAACGNNDELPAPAQEQEPISIDLRSMNYEGVMNLLSEQSSLKNVTFTDGDIQKNISELVASDNLDAEQAEQLVFRSAHAEDSVDMTVTPEYVAVRMAVAGDQVAYMAFADENQQNEIIGLYEETVPATRGGESVVTRGAGSESFRMNLTEVSKTMTAKAEAEGTNVLPERELKYQSSSVTRGWFSNLFKKVAAAFAPKAASVVKTATVTIYMMREKGANPLTHEMNWQADDAISSLKDVYSNVKFNVCVVSCDYRGSNNSDETLLGFEKWVANSPYKGKEGIYVLSRWGGYEFEGGGQVIGYGYMFDYNVNNDLQGFCIGSTSAWNKYNVAHEIGHVLGAGHTHDSLAWYERLAGYDVMAYGLLCPWLSSGKHKSAVNRAEIKKSLTLK